MSARTLLCLASSPSLFRIALVGDSDSNLELMTTMGVYIHTLSKVKKADIRSVKYEENEFFGRLRL